MSDTPTPETRPLQNADYECSQCGSYPPPPGSPAAERIEALERLVLYLAEFSEEQGADFGGFFDAEPESFNYPLLREVRTELTFGVRDV